MGFFEYYFSEYGLDKKESAVCCPFPHHTVSGLAYAESRPSAHINTHERVFHCKSCGEGRSEVSFIANILGCTYENAIKINKLFETPDDIYSWDELILPEEIKQLALSLGISEEVIKELHIRSEDNKRISFPVTMFGKIVDVRGYLPGGDPKIKSRIGAKAGCILPYDIWRLTDKKKWTIICAGEKDMAVARSNGFNAITLTGGEKAIPLHFEDFKDRRIAICYDHDDAGIAGAKALAAALKPFASEVKVVTGFHEVCVNKGEDITDFFTKYHKTKSDLIKYISETVPFTDEDVAIAKESVHPTITLMEASTPKYINKVVRSNVQVLSTYESSFVVPTTIVGSKTSSTSERDTMGVGDERTWYLSENTAQDILKLIDGNLSEDNLRENIRDILGIPKKEGGISISKPTRETVFKCTVTDLFESASTEDNITIEYVAYTLKQKLESGKKYKITYKLVPHPQKGQQLTMIILDIEQAADSVSKFKINEKTIDDLRVIQNIPGTVKDKVTQLTQHIKGLLGYDGNDQLIQAFDFAYHTPLAFNFGYFKNVRGYLDTIIVGESRIGKSSTAEALRNTYELGIFTSLAGNSATIPGLIGGSNKTSGGAFQTRAGLIPQNHKGLIVFEEFAKSNANIVKELTDIRSSNEVRITRVSGTMTLPACVRMITLTNVKPDAKGGIRPIASYPNGIEILTELVGTAEDIARYDLMLVLAYNGSNANPLWKPIEPLSKDVYKTRVRWVWSRKPEQIIISDEVTEYIVNRCLELNKRYESHIKIFGTEAWKKLSRLAIAVAGTIVSTDDTYENIIVTKDCVDYAEQFLVSIYDNNTFKLSEYVQAERRYATIDEEGIVLLQDMYTAFPSLLDQLELNSKISQTALAQISGLERDQFNKQMARLTKGRFIKYANGDVLPTQRFRLGIDRINKNTTVNRIGENDADL